MEIFLGAPIVDGSCHSIFCVVVFISSLVLVFAIGWLKRQATPAPISAYRCASAELIALSSNKFT